MRILFITGAGGVDYLSDCVFHGLVSLGFDVTDSKYLWYLSRPLPDEKRLKLYGKGFTIAGNLPDRGGVDRGGLRERILSRDFDLVVYGSAWRCLDHLDDVRKAYPKDKVVFCDGEDEAEMKTELFGSGLYFKRELASEKAFPVSFAVPEEKFAAGPDEAGKVRDVATIYPGKKNTYVYSNEEDYYRGYRESRFGVTFKKAGWDCMRHYEIIMNACLPYFKDFGQLPRRTMANWPREMQLEANDMYESKDYSGYGRLLSDFFQYARSHFTTKELAKYILSKC